MQGFYYVARMPTTAFTASRTIMQVKAGAAPLKIVEIRLGNLTKTSTELWNLIGTIWVAASLTAGTVTSATPQLTNKNDPAALAVGGTTATGYNATGEPSTATSYIPLDDGWNVLNGLYQWLPTPEQQIWVEPSGLFSFKNLTTPAASTNLVCTIGFVEYK